MIVTIEHASTNMSKGITALWSLITTYSGYRLRKTHRKQDFNTNGEAFMQALPQTAALLLIDIQKGFDHPKWTSRNNPQAEDNAARLLHAWRNYGRPVIHIKHLSQDPDSPLRADLPGSEIKDVVKPQVGEKIFQKQVNSAFIGTGLEGWLKRHNYQTLIIAGLTTPHCVSTTARMAGNLGFQTYVVSDATAAFDLIGHDGCVYSADEVHAISLATLHQEFATITDTATILSVLELPLIEE